MQSEQADADLYQPLLTGDSTVIEAVFERYGGLAYALALRIVGDPGRAEEVVQDVFTTVWSKPGRFDPARGSFRTWLLTLVRNRAIDSLRGRRRREGGEVQLAVEVPDTGIASDPWQAVSLGLERKAIKDALASIPPEQRRAIELAYFQGYSHREISEQLGLPLGTVKGQLRLGLEKLHSYLSGRGMVPQA